MIVGIMDIMPIGHYTLVESIAQIYLSDTQNEICIFINKDAENNFASLKKENSIRLKIITKKTEQTSIEFLKQINTYALSCLYVVTLEKGFKSFLIPKFTFKIYLVVHNVDLWFNSTMNFKLYTFLNQLNFSNIIFKIKNNLIYPYYRHRIIKKVLSSKGKFVVLNKTIQNELNKYIESNNSFVIPFSIYNPKLINKSITNKKIRICIPGIVESLRRNYNSILDIFEENIDFFKTKFEVDFLGPHTNSDDSKAIIKRVKKLNDLGFDMLFYNTNYIPTDTYDENLSKANIILGNMNVVLNKYSSYGKTKETGIIFTMIRAAKPGILPIEYDLLDELKSSTIQFLDYADLKLKLIELAKNPALLNQLSENALNNSKLFSASNIYNSII